MKIGILTFQFAFNYGALLQAYALKTYLEECGHDVEILNYDTSVLYKKNRPLKNRIVSGTWNLVRRFIGWKKKVEALDRFRIDFLKLSDNVLLSSDQLKDYIFANRFDAFVVGSDQVWNPVLNGHDDSYYLSFAKDSLKISYAASFGMSKIENRDLEVIKYNLSSFDAVSVRENTGAEILRSCGINSGISVVLDPVFLLSAKHWSELATTRIVSDKYVLCYVMPGDKAVELKISSVAKKIADENGYKIVYLGRKEYYRFKNDGKDIIGSSPCDFLSLIANAEVVVTNSFHGTAFSTIFNKDFYSLKNSKSSGERQLSSRINDLLKNLSLGDRLIDVCDSEILYDSIDYSYSNRILEEQVRFSKLFIDGALKNGD